MTILLAEARPAVDALMPKEQDELYTELGRRLYAIQENPSISGSFSPQLPENLEALGAAEDLKLFGERFFKRVNAQAYALMCGEQAEHSEERERVLDAFGVGKEAIATAMAGLLIVHLGLAPAIAAVVATLIIRLFFRPAYEAMCETWNDYQTGGNG